MISESHQEPHRNRIWVWALPLSALIHAIAVPWALWAFSQQLIFVQQRQPREIVLATTAVRLEKRPAPEKPNQAPKPVPQQRPPVTPQQASQASQAVPVAPPKERPELAKEVPSAPPQARTTTPAPPTEAQSVARDQQEFSREVTALNSKHANVLSIATAQPQPPASYHKSYFDVPGNRPHESSQMLLFPMQHWMQGDLSCYYVHYAAQFSNGSNESGIVPWPVCYPRADDRIARYPYPGVPLPIPYPPDGYVLPAGTYISAYLRKIYLHQL